VLNEAAILTVRENTPEITITQIDEAIDRVVGGPAKKSRVMTPKDKDIVSYHESGHALVGLKLESASKVQKVTIIPRGNAGGYTITTPNDESMFQTKQDLFATIAGYMGGRAAEAIIFGDDNVTTGADDDLEKATNIARQMVVRFGMSEALGMAKLVTQEDLSYGRTSGSYSDQTAAAIDEEVTKILTTAYNQANKIIRDNREELELLAESLRVMETITAEQIEFIDQNLALPDDVKAEKVKYDEELKRIKDGDIIDIDLADVEPKPKKEAKKPTTTKKKPKKKPEDETDDQKDDSSSKDKK